MRTAWELNRNHAQDLPRKLVPVPSDMQAAGQTTRRVFADCEAPLIGGGRAHQRPLNGSGTAVLMCVTLVSRKADGLFQPCIWK